MAAERFFHVSPSKTQNPSFIPHLIIFFLLCTNFVPNNSSDVSTILTSDFDNFYNRHCSHIVPESPVGSEQPLPPSSAASDFQIGSFRGGNPLFNRTPVAGKSQVVAFRATKTGRTFADGVYAYRAKLTLRESWPYPGHRNLRLVRVRGPRTPIRSPIVLFSLRGFWSETSRKLCMVGSGSVLYPGMEKDLRVVLKLNFPSNSVINTSLISGNLESLDSNGESSYLSPISILALSKASKYDYTLIGKGSGNGCLNGEDRRESLLALPNNEGCSVLTRTERFDLVYSGDCKGVNCNPLGGNLSYVPNYMFYERIRCDEGHRWKMVLGFPNSSYSGNRFPFDPSTTFIAEGVWNEENRLCAVACRILNFTESYDSAYVGDCSIGFSLRFPASLSLRNRSNVVGEIWSTSAVNSSGYFDKIGFRSLNEEILGLFGVEYEYTAISTLKETCVKKNGARGKGRTYPNENSMDMRFDMFVKNSKGQVASGYSTPFYVGNQLYRYQHFGFRPSSPHVTQTQISVAPNSSIADISYKISFTPPPDFKFSRDRSLSYTVEISAEGTYDGDTGTLCMRGCRHLGSKAQTNDTLDCEVMISIQFSPLNANTRKSIKGTIESTRAKSDPLYFGLLQLSSSSIYTGQAAASIWRMDLEIMMVLISNTLMCVFVGLQLFYIKSHPDVLPFISIVMLIVLTMGHMIPLLLNFEALFIPNHSQQNLFLGSGGWLEVNEVIVRIVTMVAFLLQLRLLQLTWSSRQGDGIEKSLWNSEKKVLYVTLPLYVSGALIAWFVNHLKNTSGISHRAFPSPPRKAYVVTPFQWHSFQRHSLWNDLKSYAGLVMDGFLLPQILFNLFSNSGEKALAPLFYAGTSVVRLLPHGYDLYRAHAYASYLDLSYIYASHKLDFFSTAWDIVIPCCGLLFAVLIFLQQRFGSRCILPRRFRQNTLYERVPVISNEDL